MRLENWVLVEDESDLYKAPECRYTVLAGYIYGSSKFNDGTFIRTSAVKYIDSGVAKTHSGSRYELGNVDTEYLKSYPSVLELIS